MRSSQFVLLLASMVLMLAGSVARLPLLMAIAFMPLFWALLDALFCAKGSEDE